MSNEPKTTLAKSRNPILHPERVEEVRLESLAAPVVHRRTLHASRRELRDLRKKQTAAQAIAGMDHETEIFGFTKGQFSLLDLLKAILDITGPADLVISTWTAAHHEIEAMAALRDAGGLRSARWLVDFSFARRDPAAANHIRKSFGTDAVRVAQNHAKFALFENADWRVVLRTSMNLNMNPRFEDYTIGHDPDLADFLRTIIDEIWARQRKDMLHARPKEIMSFFKDQM